jgi:ribonucleoside-diphosphate reductase alpha chain
VSGRIAARMLIDEIACSIHQTGDPTILFLDAIERGNPVAHLGHIEATNPCGEQPLLPGESCVLGSLHLPGFADAAGAIDTAKLSNVTKEGIRFLDDVVELGVYPNDWVARNTRRTRKVGLGVMGFADLLLLRGQRYGADDSRRTAREVMRVIAAAADEATIELAEARGAYPEWRGDGPPRRNATVLAIAPTGTLLLIAGCSGGIEPFIRPVITVRNPSASFRWIDSWVDGWLKEHSDEPERVLHTLEEGAPAEDLKDLSPEHQTLLRRAWEVAPEDQIAMQAEFQRSVDGAVSKTVHLPSDVTIPRIVELIQLAHRSGCKGVAFFRRGSERLLPRILPVEVDLSPPCCL